MSVNLEEEFTALVWGLLDVAPGSTTAATPTAASTTAATTQREFHSRAHIIGWLQDSFEAAGKRSMAKEEIFADYLRMCEDDNKAPFMPSMFGKLVHRAFPGLRSSRLGARGQSKHCYKCLRRRSTTTTSATSSPVPSSRATATATARLRAATHPSCSTSRSRSREEDSLSSTILATVANRRNRPQDGPEKKISKPRRERSSTSPPSTATSYTSSSTPPTSPMSSSYLTSIGSSSPRTTCWSSPPQIELDPNGRPSIQPMNSTQRQGSSPLLDRPHPFAHQSASENTAHHVDELTRMDPPAYISPLEVDYFQLSDPSDFCPWTTPTTVTPSITSTPTTSSSWSSSVYDIERFRAFLTGLAHCDVGLPGQDSYNTGARTSADPLFYRYPGSGATHMWLQAGLSSTPPTA